MQTKPISKKLRKEQTPEEKLLWKNLKDRRLADYKFRRQVTIDDYIVDFCSFEKRLVIELDGYQHLNTKSKDQERDQRLTADGFKIIRMWNSEVNKDIHKVLDKIIKALETPSSGRHA